MKYFITAMLLFTLGSCSKIPTKDIFRKSKPKVEEKKPIPEKEEKEEKVFTNKATLNADYNSVWNATIESIKWIKWKTFLTDKESGNIVLKEAYVLNKNDKLTRIYHWPPKDQLLNSDMKNYIETISNIENKELSEAAGFTHETMRINLKKSSHNLVDINFEYTIFPYLKTMELGEQINSNFYIETILIDKIKEELGYKDIKE